MATTFKRTRKRTDGTEYTVWVCEEKYFGKTKTFTGKTKKLVEEKMRSWKSELDVYGCELDKTSYNVSSLLYKHLFVNVHPNVQVSTFERYMDNYTRHVRDSDFGQLPIGDVKQIMVQEYINTLSGISDRSVTSIRYLLRQAFDMAVNNNLVRINPVTNIKIPKKKDTSNLHEVSVLSVEEQQAYIYATHNTKYRVLLLMALFTGMRRGELLALTWDNVNFVENEIHVCASVRRVKVYDENGVGHSTIETKGPKTVNSNRVIPLSSDMVKLLKEHKLKQDNSLNTLNLVFPNGLYKQLHPDHVIRIQKAVCKNAHIEYKTFHSLRHTFATRLIESKVDVKTLSKLLGHSDISITLNTYVHETKTSKQQAVDTLSDTFKLS